MSERWQRVSALLDELFELDAAARAARLAGIAADDPDLAAELTRLLSADERSGVLETRRGVGSFVSATPQHARPPGEHSRRLRSFVTRLLADATAEGFTLDDLIRALTAHQQGEQ